MIFGVKEHKKVSYEQVEQAGLQFLEREKQIISLDGLTAQALADHLEVAVKEDFPYLIITTIGEVTINQLKAIVEEAKDTIIQSQMPILIENGMKGSELEGYKHNEFTITRDIREFILWADSVCGEGIFCTCVNMGYVKLLALNPRFAIEQAGPSLQLIHINDNDAYHNLKQMPYTFSVGRGDHKSYDCLWTQMCRALIKIGFDGLMVFDTDGLFNRTPEPLIVCMLQLLLEMALMWDDMMHFENVLDCGRKIILFGAGRMASNYLKEWEDRYPPIFIVDNNQARWGQLHRGYEIQNPEAILEIPENERLVLLCNAHYKEIGLQLRRMGIDYVKYDDNMYDFVF